MIHSYFDEEFMNDPQRAFGKEYLLTNGIGASCSSTIGNCNTRKYHGLFVVQQPQIDDNDHVLVSTLDEQLTYKENIYQIATHKYPNTFYPEGYRHIADFFGNPVPKWVYQLGDCTLVKEIMMPENENAVLVRYTIEDAADKVQLNISPFLAFRNAHSVKKADLQANKKVQPVSNGIKLHLYQQYSNLYIQTSQKTEFVAAPDWYYNIEYSQEQSRGYDYNEDLFVPGHFTAKLKKGDKLVVYLGLTECNPKALSTRYTTTLKKQPVINTYTDCLAHAAKQFIIKRDDQVKIKAGYPWFGCWGRDTFISLPGLFLTTGRTKEFIDVIKTSLSDLNRGLLPNVGNGKNAVYNSVDASLWFVWAIQQYAAFTNSQPKIWNEYGKHLTDILEHYSKGTLFNIKMDTDGLVSGGSEGVALTWMDAVVNGKPVTQRTGKAVEINALWYNAVCFCIEAAKQADDHGFVSKWEYLPEQIKQSFVATFWDKERQYLADRVNDGVTDWSIRPNQVFALSMPYSPVPEYLRKPVLDIVKEELLTPKGLRTLSPKDKNYKGICEGDQETRDNAYHQGTVWPWLLGHFVEAYLNEYGSNGLGAIEKIMQDCRSLTDDPCLYTIPETYNGDYPHKPTGAIAQAWSVAELLRIEYLLAKFKESEKKYQTGLA
jgi:predicted glycogen debranching enzyme